MNGASFFYAYRMLFVPLGGRRDSGKVRGAVFGIVLSLIPVVVAIQTASGMISGIIERYLEIDSFHIAGQSYHNDFNHRASALAAEVAGAEGVVAALPVLESHVLLSSVYGRSAAALKGVPPTLYENDAGFRKYFQIPDGRFDLSAPDRILVSDGIAETLKLKPGDPVRMLLNREAGGRSFLQAVTFTVSGIFSTGYYELDHMTAYISHDRALQLFGKQGRTSLGIKLSDPGEKNAARIAGELNRRFASDGITFRTWKEKPLACGKSRQHLCSDFVDCGSDYSFGSRQYFFDYGGIRVGKTHRGGGFAQSRCASANRISGFFVGRPSDRYLRYRYRSESRSAGRRESQSADGNRRYGRLVSLRAAVRFERRRIFSK